MRVAIADIEAAAERLHGIVTRTPLINDALLDRDLGARLFVKAECLQRGGAFKIRGAYNRIAKLDPAVRARGVLAFSSGNHAIGVALAASLFNVPAAIVMPADAPTAKRTQAQAYGATIIPYDRATQDREAIGAAIAAEHGYAVVPPFDDADVIAGQGTVGLEIVEDLAARGLRPDIVLVCASGGGLAAGVSIAIKARHSDAEIYAVEPNGHADIQASLDAGVRVANPPGIRSIADALLVDRMGSIPFDVGRALWRGAVSVSDDETLDAMAIGFQRLRLVIEPGGAVALAAALTGRVDIAGKTVVAVASGGNVDPAMFARALARIA